MKKIYIAILDYKVENPAFDPKNEVEDESRIVPKTLIKKYRIKLNTDFLITCTLLRLTPLMPLLGKKIHLENIVGVSYFELSNIDNPNDFETSIEISKSELGK